MHRRAEQGLAMQKASETNGIIQVQGLSKSYGETRALENVAFHVGRSEVFAYLGPNGAGKTTTINVLCGLIPRDAGEVKVCGLDIDKDPVAVKQQIGVVPEESNLYPELTCRRNLEYLGELYGLPRAVRRSRAIELLELFDLTDRAAAPFRALSRGMKRRLTVAAGLMHSPEVVFMDEPTAGLDVPSARSLRSLIQSINRDGTTVFLTTHNLAEAESLSDRVLILVKGRVAAQGTAEEIRHRVERARVLSAVLSGGATEEALRAECPAIQAAAVEEGRWRIEVTDTHAALAQLLSFAEKQGVRVLEIGTATPSLEDAFMTILRDNPHRAEVGT